MTRPLADIVYGACANPNLIIGGDPRDTKGNREIAFQLRDKLRNARRFYVDEDVTRAATRLGVQHPSVLMEMLRRARPPFQKIWIEWPLAAQIEEAGQDIADDAPVRTGCFVEHIGQEEPIFLVTAIGAPPANEPRSNTISVSQAAVLYHLQSPIATAPRLVEMESQLGGLAGLPQDLMARSLIGSAYAGRNYDDATEEEIQLRFEQCDRLSSYAAWILNPMLRKWHTNVLATDMYGGKRFRMVGEPGRTVTAIEALRSTVQTSILEHAGMWRFVIALLALINNQEYTETESYRAGKSQLISGHVVPYLEHLLVKLKLPRRVTEERVLRDLTDAMGFATRRHEVMGHFRQSRKRGDPDCDHAYIDVTPTRCRCTICGHSIWWVDEYERGNAALGYVIKDRLVTRD